MSDQTTIEWADSTFNPWMGCTKVSPACDHCYAERDTRRFGRVEWGSGKPRVRTSAANWKLPERWNYTAWRECRACGWRGHIRASFGESRYGDRSTCPSCASVEIVPARRRVFSASLADWLDNEVPIEWLVDLLDLIRRTPNIDWLVLTKRIGNWQGRLVSAASECRSGGIEARIELGSWINLWIAGNPPANVWLGATVVNQAEADRDAPKLLQVPASVRFLSIEPMLGPIGLNMVAVPEDQDQLPRYAGGDGSKFNALQLHDDDRFHQPPAKLDWIISGGESGPHARPMHPDWVRSLRDQCEAAGVPFLFKQWGEWHPEMAKAELCVITSDGKDFLRGPETMNRRDDANAEIMWRIGKKAAGRQLDGRTHDGFPAVSP